MKSILTVGILLLALILTPTSHVPLEACVGKTLHIASNGSVQQDFLAHALATLIGERTGTTVKVDTFSSQRAVHEALLKAEIDIAVEYTAHARGEILQKAPLADPAALYQAVRDDYTQELNLIWLTPFGFGDAPLGQGAPVVRKDTLKKFPALARLIEKLGNRIDGTTLQKLEAQIKAGKQAPEVARAFLKELKLI